MGKTLYGRISNSDNVEYEWRAEPGACKVCQGLSGTIYDSANDIPDRPHPNCKCHIEILEKESDEPISDPIEAHREKIKDRKRNELEIAKMLGDVKSLEQEIDEYIKRVNEQDSEIEKLENSVDISNLDSKDRQKISDAKEKLDYAKYKGDKVKQEVSNLKTEIENTRFSDNIADALDKLYYRFQILKKQIGRASCRERV